MRWNREIVQRVFVLGLIGLLAAVVAGGCSSVDPTDRWSSTTGSVTGTVRSSEGDAVEGVEVWLWTELSPDGQDVSYDTITDQWGSYEFPEVEMATQHSFQQTYWICANRTPERASSTNVHYGTVITTLTVERDSECVADMSIEAIDDNPDDPESYIED
jgi:hypothetical protein